MLIAARHQPGSAKKVQLAGLSGHRKRQHAISQGNLWRPGKRAPHPEFALWTHCDFHRQCSRS